MDSYIDELQSLHESAEYNCDYEAFCIRIIEVFGLLDSDDRVELLLHYMIHFHNDDLQYFPLAISNYNNSL